MTAEEQRALLAVALLAAFTDGDKSEAEREEVKRIATTLGNQAGGLNIPALMQDVLLKRLGLTEAVSVLKAREHRQLAYELAVCVCDADGVQTPAERQFLASLKAELGGTLDTAFEAQADGLARETDSPAATSAGAGAAATIDRAALDKSIFNRAVLCGALELLPQSWASMAIIPLQVKLVYGIGQAHGVALDQGHVKEFLATVGVGLTSQYLEQFGRKLLGGLLGGVGGGLGRTVGRQAASSGLTFATTYALGRVAQRYYAGGRTLDTATLKQTFADLLAEARTLAPGYRAQIEQKAGTIDVRSLASLVKQA